MLKMSIKVSFGWMLGSSKNMIDETLLRQIKYSVGIVAVLEVHVELSPTFKVDKNRMKQCSVPHAACYICFYRAKQYS